MRGLLHVLQQDMLRTVCNENGGDNEKAMKDVINGKVEAVEGAMNDLEECVKEKTRRHMTALEDMTRYVDA